MAVLLTLLVGCSGGIERQVNRIATLDSQLVELLDWRDDLSAATWPSYRTIAVEAKRQADQHLSLVDQLQGLEGPILTSCLDTAGVDFHLCEMKRAQEAFAEVLTHPPGERGQLFDETNDLWHHIEYHRRALVALGFPDLR